MLDEQITNAVTIFFAEGLALIPKMLAALVIFIIGLYLGGLFSRLLRRTLEERGRDPELTLFLAQITRWGTVIFFTIVALQQVDFNLTTFVAGLGILGFTVGFALQDVSKNFIAGLLLLLQQPFDLGDIIEVSGYTGRVLTVDLRATELRTLDGKMVQIPNGDVFTQPIVNVNRNPFRRVQLEVGVAPDSDLEEARRVASTAVERVNGVLPEPAPGVYFHTFGAASIDFTLMFWVDMLQTDPMTAKDEALTTVYQAFAASGVDLASPVQRVKLEQ